MTPDLIVDRPHTTGPVSLHEADLPALAEHLLRLSPEDRELRFQGRVSVSAIQSYALGINLHRDVLCGAYAGGRLVGACHVGVYLEGGDAVGEVGVSLDDEARGSGLARRLIEAARSLAAERGVRRLDFVFLRGNHAMLQLARRLDADVTFDDGEWRATLDIAEAAPAPAMSELRSAATGIEVLATDGDPARTALLVHGAGGDPWQFRRHFVPQLKALGLRVVALSLRHHGRSARTGSARLAQHVADVLRVIQDLGRPQLMVGHSMGALVVQHVMRQVPVPRVALLAPVPPDGLPGAALGQALGALKTHAARTALAEALVDYAPLPPQARAPQPAPQVCVVGGLHDQVVAPAAVRRTAAFYGTRAVMLEAGHGLTGGRVGEHAARVAIGGLQTRHRGPGQLPISARRCAADRSSAPAVASAAASASRSSAAPRP